MALFRRKPKGPVIRRTVLNMHWDTEDPFTFASHHEDDYPHGNAQLAPPLDEIRGRDLGRDYEKRLGFRMYHGKVVPGFPAHAHWGYETVTLPETGYVDHFDSLGNQGRFGFGDVQWVCAPSRYTHDEMYPLVDQEGRNPNDITQIMVNLPLEMKGGPCAVNDVWRGDVPSVTGDGYEVRVLCGSFGGSPTMTSPSPVSWTHEPSHAVRILRISMEPGAEVVLDATSGRANRNLYNVSGDGYTVDGIGVPRESRVKAVADADLRIVNGDEPTVLWVLEGVPIGQRMESYGPVVLGSTDEVRAAMQDIRTDQFKDWDWDVIDKAQPVDAGRFIRYADGTEERPS